MIWSLVDDGYEVTLAHSLDQVADDAMNGERFRYIQVSGSNERVKVHSKDELKKLLKGKNRFYVYNEDWPCNDWIYKCVRQK